MHSSSRTRVAAATLRIHRSWFTTPTACLRVGASRVSAVTRLSGVRTCASASGPGAPPDKASSGVPAVKGGKIQIAVVGSGPSGCYVAEYLTKANGNVHVDVFERLPVPFGLCRYGVAPDHADVKNVEKKFMEMFKSGRATFVGNVRVGRDIPVPVLMSHYSAVVFATGADDSKKLHLPGEHLGGVLGASQLVSYYNTLPFPYGSPRTSPVDVASARRVVIIGNGNVAMDCARVLAAPYKHFCSTDMNCVAVRELMGSRVESVLVTGRRGVEQSAFALAEFRELTTFQPASVKVRVDDFDLAQALACTTDNPRAHKRMMEYLHRFVSTATGDADISTATPPAGTEGTAIALREAEARLPRKREVCTVDFRYNLKPVRILEHPQRKGYVGAVVFDKTGAATRASALDGGEVAPSSFVTVPCDAVVKSIGYRSDSIADVPFDHKHGVIPHSAGRVVGVPRMYCAGWVKRGPRGVILHSLVDSQETAASILADITSGLLHNNDSEYCGKYGLIEYFVAKNIHPVSMAGLERINYVEHQRGIDLGKRLEKVESVRDMLDIALGGEIGKKTNDAVRGITKARPDAMLYLKELLDDDTDLAPLARQLAKEIPPIMAEQHPTGSMNPSQL